MAKSTLSVEAQVILQNLDSETLESFNQLAQSKFFEPLRLFCKRLAETKRNQVLDLPTENERKLANEIAIRKGAIYTAGVIIDIISNAQKELSRRK